MIFTVEVTLRTARPLTERALTNVAAIGGAAAGNVGERRLETILTVEAKDIREAAEHGVLQIMKIVPGVVVAVESMTTDEADRRLNERPEIVGVTEVAGMLGVSKQRVSALSKRVDFPAPLARLGSGPVWRAGDLSTFAGGWQRKAGRPKKVAEPA
jgi:hypothetical protein